jgi:hypothetical protein
MRRAGTARIWVLVGVMGVLAAAVVASWLLRGSTQATPDESRLVAEKFLEQVRAGQAAQAWESTTSEFKSFEGRETFLKFVKQHPAMAKPLSFVSVQTVAVGQSPRSECIFRASDMSGTFHVLVGNDRGSWRVDRVRAD